MAAVSGYVVDMDSRDSLLFNYSSAFKIMAVCWAADLMVVKGLNVPERAGMHRVVYWCLMIYFMFRGFNKSMGRGWENVFLHENYCLPVLVRDGWVCVWSHGASLLAAGGPGREGEL